MITAILLALVSIVPASPQPIHVEVCEINTTTLKSGTEIKQVILYRWMRLSHGNSHHVASWWTVNEEPEVRRIGDRWRIRSKYQGEWQEFTARSVRYTATRFDPELEDRSRLNYDDRVPYRLRQKRDVIVWGLEDDQ